MPVVLPAPNLSTTSKRPSPFASRRPTAPPPVSGCAAAAAGLQRHVQVAVARHRHVPRYAKVVGHHLRAEAGQQPDAAVVGVARSVSLALKERSSPRAILLLRLRQRLNNASSSACGDRIISHSSVYSLRSTVYSPADP